MRLALRTLRLKATSSRPAVANKQWILTAHGCGPDLKHPFSALDKRPFSGGLAQLPIFEPEVFAGMCC